MIMIMIMIIKHDKKDDEEDKRLMRRDLTVNKLTSMPLDHGMDPALYRM